MSSPHEPVGLPLHHQTGVLCFMRLNVIVSHRDVMMLIIFLRKKELRFRIIGAVVEKKTPYIDKQWRVDRRSL
jgi:hypothetical protein